MEMGSSSVTESGGSSSSSPPTESLNGLKFGQKIYFEDVGSGAPPKSASGSSSSAAATHKKGRVGVYQSGQPPRCQVEGCRVDLSDAKAYYSRHKVCGMHSKFPMVIVAGIEQRFCQQCSRFHQLQEFDQGKRSCRRRLAGHNERRRKPPPGSLFSTRYGHLPPSIFDNGSRGGSILMDFSAYPKLGQEAWPSSRSSERDNDNQTNSIMGKLLPHSWQISTENTPSQLLVHNSNGVAHFVGPGVPSREFVTGATDSICALSLLSNQPWGSSGNHRASGFGINPMMNNTQGVPTAQTTGHSGSVTHFLTTPWGLKSNEAISCSNETTSDLGLCQISLPFNTSYSEDLEIPQHGRRPYMEPMHPRTFDLSTQQTHWSL